MTNKKSKLRGLSLFANVGIAEAYFPQIGVEIKVANEILPERARFYSEIYKETNMICGDITNDELRTQIIEESIAKDVNFVMATPPCQGMSRVGKMDKYDVRNQLIYYVVDVIKRVKPEYVLIENVSTILKTRVVIEGKELLIPDYLHNELDGDYVFNETTKVKAMYYSIPQMRLRNIYLLVRKDKKVKWEFPPHTPVVTLEDAISSLPDVDPLLREGEKFTISKFPDYIRKKEEAAKISKWHRPPVHSWKLVEWMMHTPTNESAIYNEVYYPQKEDGTRVKAHYNQYRRLAWNTPARCLTQNNGVISSLACVHPGRPYIKDGHTLYTNPRVLTIYEIMIVSSLPLDWPIPDWAGENFIRKVIGEGIPSKLIKVIVESLLNQI